MNKESVDGQGLEADRLADIKADARIAPTKPLHAPHL